jgi:ATP-dependent RNA helicase DDX24/MAK5
VLVGGLAAVKQERILNTGPEIVIATPGRLWELIYEGNPHLSQIDSIKYDI